MDAAYSSVERTNVIYQQNSKPGNPGDPTQNRA